MSDQIKIVQPHRSPNEFQCYLQGARAAAAALGYSVDADAWGGGMPIDLTLYPKPVPKEPVKDVYEEAVERAAIPDTTTEEDSEGPAPDREPFAST